jgi:hypothetical protein
MVILYLEVDVTDTPFIHNCSSQFEFISEMSIADSSRVSKSGPVPVFCLLWQ